MKPHLDAVLAACRRDPEFRWSIESIWQLEAWLDRTPDRAQIQEMKSRIEAGQIDVSATWGSMHTEFMGTEELNRLDDASKKLSATFGLRGDMAMEDDVPGFSLRLPQVLARSGVRYLVNGANTAFGGGTSISPKYAPFYWASPDGSRVLLWTTKGGEGGYTEGMTDYYLDPSALDPYQHTPFYPKEWKGLPDEEITSRGLQKLLSHYTDAGFHGRSIAVLYMHDGIGPEYEESLLRNVQKWNAAGRLPHLRVATPTEYFNSFTTNELASLPVYSGDWSGLWSESKTGSPAISADARLVQEALPMAETAASLAMWNGASHGYPAEALQVAMTNLFRYDEHNGAGNAGWPKVLTEAEVNRSNLEYATYMRTAKDNVEKVLSDSIPKLFQTRSESTAVRFLVVTNLRSWPRTDVVEASAPPGHFILKDAVTHQVIAAQRTSPGGFSFIAHDVPPLGYKTYTLEPASKDRWATSSDEKVRAENHRYLVEVDRATGEINRVIDKRTSQNLLREDGPRVVHSIDLLKPATGVKVLHVAGPVEDSILVTRPDSWWPQTVISLPHDLDEIRFEEVLDRTRMPFVRYGQPSDRYEIRFPFVTSGTIQEWIDDGIGFHRMPQDQMLGTRLDGAVPRFVVALSSEQPKHPETILFAQAESFFTRPGKLPGDITVTAMSKGDQGETKDHGIVTFASYEPGYSPEYQFHFQITRKESAFNSVEAYRFGRDGATRLTTQLLDPHLAPTVLQRSYLSIRDDNVVIDDLRLGQTGAFPEYVVRLQEISGKETVTSLISPGWSLEAETTDLTGTSTLSRVDVANIHLAPHETVTLRLKVEQSKSTSTETK